MAKGDVAAVAGCLRYYGGWADKIEGKVIDTDPEYFTYTKQEPVRSLAFFMHYSLTNVYQDWCLRSDYSMEFPIAHVGMEDRSCCRNW